MARSVNDTISKEHQESADAKRVFLVDANGNPLGELVISGNVVSKIVDANGNPLDVDLSGIRALKTFIYGMPDVHTTVGRSVYFHGAKGSISTSAVQLQASSQPLYNGVLLKADTANTGTLYVGKGTVTNGSVDATDGYPLEAGEAFFLEVSDLNLVYVIASAAGQKIRFIAV